MRAMFAVVDGGNRLVNFRTKDDVVTMLVQKMDEPLEVVEVKSIFTSDVDPSTAIINGSIVLQMDPREIAYIYARFHMVDR